MKHPFYTYTWGPPKVGRIKPHNPDNVKTIGSGYRLLDREEVASTHWFKVPIRGLDIWSPATKSWITGCVLCGDDVNSTYRTKLTCKQLREARGLE